MMSDYEAELAEMREYARAEAEDAGLNEVDQDAVVDIAMSAIWKVDERIDRDHFEEMVAHVIQGVANP